MRRIIASLIIMASLIFPALSLAGHAGAVDIFNDVCSGNGGGSTACQSVNQQKGQKGDNPIIDIIRTAIEVISFIIGIAAIIGIVVSAIRMITSGGDSSAMASARGGLVSSLVGVAVAALALVLVQFVLKGN